jgi:hypothetical protein
MIVSRSRSFRFIVNVSIMGANLLPQPRPKGDISIELQRGHFHGVSTRGTGRLPVLPTCATHPLPPTHSRMVVALMLTCIVPPLRAQIVNDGATNTLSNVTNSFTGDVTVGTNGLFTLLILSDNALLTNSANGLIGRNASDITIPVPAPTGNKFYRLHWP